MKSNSHQSKISTLKWKKYSLKCILKVYNSNLNSENEQWDCINLKKICIYLARASLYTISDFKI